MPSNSSPTHFQGQYRIASARLPGWDYSAAAYYFVTIVTAQREHFFGAVVNAAVVLSPFGECADAEWAKSAVLRPNIALDEYIVMPNHVHGIVIIKTVDGMIPPVRRDALQRVSTLRGAKMNLAHYCLGRCNR